MKNIPKHAIVFMKWSLRCFTYRTQKTSCAVVTVSIRIEPRFQSAQIYSICITLQNKIVQISHTIRFVAPWSGTNFFECKHFVHQLNASCDCQLEYHSHHVCLDYRQETVIIIINSYRLDYIINWIKCYKFLPFMFKPKIWTSLIIFTSNNHKKWILTGIRSRLTTVSLLRRP